MSKKAQGRPNALLKVVRTEVFRQRVETDRTRYTRKTKNRRQQESWPKFVQVA